MTKLNLQNDNRTRKKASSLIGLGSALFIFFYDWLEISLIPKNSIFLIVLNAVVGGLVIALSAYVILHLYSRVREKEVRDESEKKFKSVSVATQDAIVILDAATNILFWNKASEKIFGYQESEVLNKPLRAVIDHKLAPQRTGDLTEIIPVSENILRMTAKRKNGEEFPIELTMSGIKTAGEWNTVGIIRDITDRQKQEERLREAHSRIKDARARLEEADTAGTVRRLAGGVAHDVKNPLTVILQSAEYLSQIIKTDDKTVAKSLNFITDAVGQADTLVRGLMDISSAAELHPTDSDVNELIEKSLLLVKYQLNKKGIQVVKELDPKIGRLHLDPKKMEQVFVNLFVNSIDAMDVEGVLEVRSRVDSDEKIKITIQDNGSGIPNDVIKNVFDPFFTTKQKTGGTGLGLSSVKSAVEMHGGEIDICNKSEGGVIVSVYLKRKKGGE